VPACAALRRSLARVTPACLTVLVPDLDRASALGNQPERFDNHEKPGPALLTAEALIAGGDPLKISAFHKLIAEGAIS
jgi:hypothetical protein